jgi:hypothetical protein
MVIEAHRPADLISTREQDRTGQEQGAMREAIHDIIIETRKLG